MRWPGFRPSTTLGMERDCFSASGPRPLQARAVLFELAKIFAPLVRRVGAQTFVVLDAPLAHVGTDTTSPCAEVAEREKLQHRFAFAGFDDENDEELDIWRIPLQKRRPQAVDEVDEQAANVAAVKVLVRHEQHAPVSQLEVGCS